MKTAIVTGASSGIGFATAKALAEQGWRVVMASRDPEKNERAAKELQRLTGSGELIPMTLDLASFRSVRAFAKSFLAQQEGLDVLINNAGIYTSDFQETEDGFEMQIGVNHFGHFLLTHLLRERLAQSADPRLVVVSSVAHIQGQIDFDSFRAEKGVYKGFRAYRQSKLANVLFTVEHARRFPGITANCLHPGGVRTPIATKHSNWYTTLGWRLLTPFLIPPERGARTSLFLATAPEIKGQSGGYYDDKQRKRNLVPQARDEEMARRLWEYSEGSCIGEEKEP